MSILGIGLSPEDFTGWDDVSSPIYTGVDHSSPCNTQWGRPHILLTTSTVDPISKTYSCMKLPFSEAVNAFSVNMNRYFGTRSAFTGGISPTGARVFSVIHAKDGHRVVCAPTGATNTFDIYLVPDFYTWSTWVPLGMTFVVSGQFTNFTILIKGGGTASGEIELTYGVGSDGYMESPTTLSWTGDLTDYHDFVAVSCHDPFSSADGADLLSVVAATEDLTGAYVCVYIPQTAGTISGWYNGSYTAAAGSIPAVVATYTNGLYALAPNTQQTFVPSAAYQSGSSSSTKLLYNYTVAYVVAKVAAFIQDDTTGSTLQPIVYDPTTKVATPMGDAPQAPTVALNQMVWISSKDPSTDRAWSDIDLLRYELGYERVK